MAALGYLLPMLAAGGWLWWIYQNDRFEKEPWDFVLRTAGFGAAAGVGTLILQRILIAVFKGGGLSAGLFVGVILGAAHLGALTAVLYYVPFRNPHWNERFDGIVYGGAAGVGYGLLYTILGLVATPLLGYRIAVFSIPIYMLAGLVLGHYMSKVKFSAPDESSKLWTRGFLIAGAYLMGTEAAQAMGGIVVAGNVTAAVVSYGSNMLGWVLAMRAMTMHTERSQYNPELYQLQMAPTGCPHCGYGYPVGSVYCNTCGNPIQQQKEA